MLFWYPLHVFLSFWGELVVASKFSKKRLYIYTGKVSTFHFASDPLDVLFGNKRSYTHEITGDMVILQL